MQGKIDVYGRGQNATVIVELKTRSNSSYQRISHQNQLSLYIFDFMDQYIRGLEQQGRSWEEILELSKGHLFYTDIVGVLEQTQSRINTNPKVQLTVYDFLAGQKQQVLLSLFQMSMKARNQHLLFLHSLRSLLQPELEVNI